MKDFEKELQEFSGELEEVKREIAKRDFNESLSGADESVEKKHYFPVDIYLDTDDPAVLEKVNNSVKEFLQSLDVEMFTKAEIFKGSIIEKFWAGTKSILSHMELVKKLYNSVKEMLSKRESQAKNFGKNFNFPSQKLAETIRSLKDVPNISIRVGSVLLTKATVKDVPVIQVKNLTREEMLILEKKPSLLRTPRLIHNRLNRMKAENAISKSNGMGMN